MAAHIAHTDYVTRNDDVIAADCNNEIVLLRVKSARCYGMNEVGTHIWRKLSRPVRVAELVDTLQLEFAANSHECGPEIVDFLEHLSREGLIVQVEAPAPAGPRVTQQLNGGG
jgi:hypothetical protein